MRTKIVAAALGCGFVISSLVGGIDASAAPHGGGSTMAVSHVACDCESMVTTSALNLRSGPGTGYDVLLVMPEGATVQAALSQDHQAKAWIKVRYGETWGWASEEYLAASAPAGVEAGDITGGAFTTTAVNFRGGPGTDYDAYYVISEGSQVAITDDVANGFRQVYHAGNSGWVYDEYLSQDFGGGNGGGATVGTGATNDWVNFREGPGTGYGVIEVLAPGTAVGFTDTVENGFRLVTVNGVDGWIHTDYVTPPASLPDAPTTGTATTTDWVNFRVGPSLGHDVRDVLAPGTEVETTDIVENGFHQVSVDGTMGWVHVDYLN